MVEKDAHIDLVFRNGLKDFEALPPAGLWDEIEPVIKKNRSFLLLRVAATILILFSLGFLGSLLRKQNSPIQPDQLIVSNQVVIQSGSNTPIFNDSFLEKTSDNSLSGVSKVQPKIEIAPEFLNYKAFQNTDNFTEIKINSTSILTDKEAERIESDLIPTLSSSGFTIFDKKEQINLVPTEKSDLDKWMVGALGAPTYYLAYSPDKLNLTTQLQKAEESMITYSGGVSFAYAINRKLSIQSGFYYSSIGNKLRGVETYSGFGNYVNTKSRSNFGLATTNGMVVTTNNDVYMSDNSSNRISTTYTNDVFDPSKAELQYVNNVVRQSFQYLEVPVIMRYKILDKKIDVNLLGGLSYNLLIGNSVYAVSSGKNVFIGKTEGINPIAFSSSVGFGMAYDISKKLSLNLEPTMRYYLSKTGDRTDGRNHPYLFGIYSGIFYKF